MQILLVLVVSFGFAQNTDFEGWDKSFQENHQKCMKATQYDLAVNAAEKMLGSMMKINDYLSKNVATDQATAIKQEKKYSNKYSDCAQVRIRLYGKN